MNRVRCLWFLIGGLFSLTSGKDLCDFADIKCMTRAANNVFKNSVHGVKDLIEPIDPLVVATFEGELLTLKYKLTNATLKGLKKCVVTQLIFDKEKSTFEHDLQCPEISISYIFETEGFVGDVEINGKGSATKTLDDYMLIVRGKYEKFISEKDHKAHIFIEGFSLESIPRGSVKLEVHELCNGDKMKFDLAKDYINKNWKTFDPRIRASLMTKFVEVLMKSIDTYLRHFPLDEVIPA